MRNMSVNYLPFKKKESLDSLQANHVTLNPQDFTLCSALIDLDQNIISILIEFVNVTKLVRTVNTLDNTMGFLLYFKGLKNGLTAIYLKFNKEKCKCLQIHENNLKIQDERIWIQWCEKYG